MMLASADRPLILLDVDGPLIPFRARPALRPPPSGDLAEPVHGEPSNPLVDRLDPADGRRLLGLGCQLVWATTWMADANEVISPRLGLPTLPVVDFPDTDDEPAGGLHWKTMTSPRFTDGSRAHDQICSKVAAIARHGGSNSVRAVQDGLQLCPSSSGRHAIRPNGLTARRCALFLRRAVRAPSVQM